MEIKHRLQPITGKWVAQAREPGGEFRDATAEDLEQGSKCVIDIIKELTEGSLDLRKRYDDLWSENQRLMDQVNGLIENNKRIRTKIREQKEADQALVEKKLQVLVDIADLPDSIKSLHEKLDKVIADALSLGRGFATVTLRDFNHVPFLNVIGQPLPEQDVTDYPPAVWAEQQGESDVS